MPLVDYSMHRGVASGRGLSQLMACASLQARTRIRCACRARKRGTRETESHPPCTPEGPAPRHRNVALDPAGARGGSLGRGGEGQLNEQQADDQGQVTERIVEALRPANRPSGSVGRARRRCSGAGRSGAVQRQVQPERQISSWRHRLRAFDARGARRRGSGRGHLVGPFVAPGSPRVGLPGRALTTTNEAPRASTPAEC